MYQEFETGLRQMALDGLLLRPQSDFGRLRPPQASDFEPDRGVGLTQGQEDGSPNMNASKASCDGMCPGLQGSQEQPIEETPQAGTGPTAGSVDPSRGQEFSCPLLTPTADLSPAGR